MPDIKIRITNLPEIKRAFGQAPQLMSKHFNVAIKQATFLVEGKSKINAPVDTGYLMGSHRTKFLGSGIGFTGIVYPKADYAMFVHQGTRFMKARPFLKDAAESSENQIERLFTQALQGVLNDIGRMV